MFSDARSVGKLGLRLQRQSSSELEKVVNNAGRLLIPQGPQEAQAGDSEGVRVELACGWSGNTQRTTKFSCEQSTGQVSQRLGNRTEHNKLVSQIRKTPFDLFLLISGIRQ